MRPVSRPRWSDRWAALDAADAVAAALGEYCSACEMPLLPPGVGWHAGTGELVTGPVNPADWPDLLVLCRHCANAASLRGPANWGAPLLPDRDATFALGGSAPFRYELAALEVAGADGGPPEVVERVFLVPNGESAADTVRLFGLNGSHPADPAGGVLAGAERAELPLSGRRRRQLLEFDDGRTMLRTKAWRYAHRAGELYPAMTDAGDLDTWAQLLAGAISARGFWSVWASVLTAAVPDLPLLASVLAPQAVLASGSQLPSAVADGGGPQPVIESIQAFPATRSDWLHPQPEDTGEQS